MTQQANEPAVGGDDRVVAAEPTAEDRLNAAFDDPANQQETDEDPAEGETAEEAEDDLTLEEEADDLPPIDAPVSWDAEAKAKFSELPRDVQEVVAKRETERERFVQQKSQEATQAKAMALQQAHAELAQINAQYAQQLQQIAHSVQAQEPDPMLQLSDPVAYAQQMQTFKRSEAQRSQAQQTAALHAQQAQAYAYQAAQAEQAEQHRVIVEQFPEYADPTTGPKLRAELSAVAKDVLGYPDELIGQARATDIIAMKRVLDLKVKADKYDALISKQMAKVRAGKAPPRASTPGTQRAPGAARQQQYATDREALRQGDTRATQRVLDSFFTKSK